MRHRSLTSKYPFPCGPWLAIRLCYNYKNIDFSYRSLRSVYCISTCAKTVQFVINKDHVKRSLRLSTVLLINHKMKKNSTESFDYIKTNDSLANLLSLFDCFHYFFTISLSNLKWDNRYASDLPLYYSIDWK